MPSSLYATLGMSSSQVMMLEGRLGLMYFMARRKLKSAKVTRKG
jgi:hypothetical protein